MLALALLLLAARAACAAPTAAATQLRITFSPNADELIAGWTSMGAAAPGATRIQAGPSPTSLTFSGAGSAVAFENDQCPGSNATRTSHAAPFPAPQGATTYYRVSADAGASWSPVQAARNPARAYPVTVALWGDLGVECGGVLPPSPGFAGGQCTAVPQLAKDSAAGAHQYTIHFGVRPASARVFTRAHCLALTLFSPSLCAQDSAYNMDERCGQKGDAFLDATSAYAAQRPHVYTNGSASWRARREMCSRPCSQPPPFPRTALRAQTTRAAASSSRTLSSPSAWPSRRLRWPMPAAPAATGGCCGQWGQ